MAGIITGSYGFQRSGKTLLMYLLAETYKKRYGYEVYSNMIVPEWVHLKKLSQLPLNTKPKILLLDEAYFFLDSRNWKKNANNTIFFNTIGKQNILLLITAIDPSEVDIRIRRQHNYMFIVKKIIQNDIPTINYRIIDTQRDIRKDFTLKLLPELTSRLNYDTKQIPEPIDFDIDNFIERVREYNKKVITTKNTNKKSRGLESGAKA